ncbi:MAG: glycosyltransferase [Bacteroidota bacterium]|nr:glycosyltransferase [Bacteroidota bacterium]
MSRKKILWLCSWYPNKKGPFDGDFIQRHARAAALYNDIYVLHVAGDVSGKTGQTEDVITRTEGLTEHIVYYKRSASLVGKLLSHYRWLSLSKKAIREYIRNHRQPDLVHVHVPIKAGIAALWVKKKFSIPFVVTEHWGIYNEVEVLNYTGRPAAFKRYTVKIFREAARFISVSRYLAEGVNRLVTSKAYTVIPNVVDTTLFNYQDPQQSPFHFIHVSNMVPLKNAKGILHAFKLLLQQSSGADVRLIMVGYANAEIREYASELGLKDASLSFRGEITYPQVAVEMQQSHCLLIFSNIENSPCVIGEAFCCGVPVIATAVGGIPELVNESNAVLVKPGDEKSLAVTMQQMMVRYAAYNRKKIAEDAISKFSYLVTGKQFDEIYSATLRGRD